MLSTGQACPVCGGFDCDDEIASAMTILSNPPKQERLNGKSYRTTERIFGPGYLLYGPGVDLPWKEAQRLGLVPLDETDEPILAVLPEPEQIQVLTDDDDVIPEQAAGVAETAAIRRRRRK